MAKIVWIQRYPTDKPIPVAFANDYKALRYLRQKQDDYRYTTGRVWSDADRGDSLEEQ